MRFLSDCRRLLLLSCEESSEWVSRSLDARLPAWQRAAVRFHALYCRSCRRFRRQLLFLRAASAHYPAWETGEPSQPPLPAEVRDRLNRAVARHLDDRSK